MSSLRIHANAAAPGGAPRGARWAAAAFMALWQMGERMFRSRSRSRSRAAARAVADANGVRRLAREYQLSDPHFAQDLFSAADRHERLHG